ncbi:Uncharacterized conserved protein, DUF305 family [Streptoalloteichus tenebrarius]|uniref:Uncharacterized conserved protein, DUF305 family n=1 Tax=Streptoalloteichus tenebrarius (strain ATCC 17920 / DSM 40477 / JCM 4838 / CBS 697.72 / NBRC 16177 / NCIMB 11028 / NRRL B-12390 / A12253. 1 / ISP 5477) TaxID=1933 RepID=A0ABT1HXM5_STRSD|nr:DUF305 domain-containing protein [Streptoalloteichus tenebrarius]MCP2260276.1 Uncharacterized conserved protein, DUF305 family [Streptoalloteichus tenebrarius]
MTVSHNSADSTTSPTSADSADSADNAALGSDGLPETARAGGEPVARPAGVVARVVVISAAVLAVLLLGAAAGMLVGLPNAKDQAAPGPGSVDVGFAQDMSVHHLQAVQMAGWARDHTGDPVIRQIAFDIESSQQEQVGRMKGWLALWNQPEVPYGGHMAWMADADGGHSGHGGPSAPSATATATPTMPGMATQQELARLRSLSGREMDVYFLQLMLRHHKGGVPMLRYAVDRASQSVVRNLASSMLGTQTKETETLEALLAERGGQPLPAN